MITGQASDPSPYWTYEGIAVVGLLGALVVIVVGLAVRRGFSKYDKTAREPKRLLRPTATVLAVVGLVASTLAITRGMSGATVWAPAVLGCGALGLVGGRLAIGRVLAVIQGAIWLALLAQGSLGILLGAVAWGAAAAARIRPLLASLLLALPSVALAVANVVEATRPTDASQVILAVAVSLPGLIAAGLIGARSPRRVD